MRGCQLANQNAHRKDAIPVHLNLLLHPSKLTWLESLSKSLAMSTSSRRRNRSLASCEPCRKSKIRCDHRKPICASCQRRGLHSQCWYHPAPLTKQQTSQEPTLSTPPLSYHEAQEGPSNKVNNPPAGTPIFHAWPFMSADPSGSTSQATIPGHHNYSIKAHNEHLATIEDIVSQLKLLPVIEKRLQEYYSFSQVALVPRPLVLQLVASIRIGLATAGYIKEESDDEISVHHCSRLAEDLLRSSSSEVIITPDLDLGAFCALFGGAHLRIETIGLLYTMAARSSLYAVSHRREKYQDDGFIQEMAWYGNLSLRLSRELAPQTTDLMIWLAHESLQLTTLFEGDASLGVWRRVGDLATDLLALGLNREATYSDTPFFLAQCRRRTFARAYYLDKVFAAVFNRPPRINSRHADCSLPLDLSDDELFTSSDQQEQAKCNLTQDGWNTDGKHRAATWVRIRYILAQFREETVEYQFRSIQPADTIKLRDLSNRCQQAWNRLPYYLQYRQDCWKSNLPPILCYMHAKVYLSYLHINFQIHRLLGSSDGNMTPQLELLEVSAKMLETIVQMANYRRRTSFSPPDLPGIILSYGLPCAAILSTALDPVIQGSSRKTELSPSMKTSNLIRNLSVLVNQLESVSSPSDTNHVFCLKSSKAISRKLDRILDSFTTSISTNPPDHPEPATTPYTLDNASFEAMADIDNTGPVDFDFFDLADWAIDFDRGAMGDEYNMV
ncbi:uncharacterized protein N7511_000881 [Penicillium nucicola]|uniref:uncharacterized protein n=1 Tax=Penicillium nucicola TaxID=1850975 RepID=UPI0025459478|nr:uncharacterized protein N7511_000881 [Penicillium nucicola]KAJ5775870.1 hypothetical protein N7511_000881 [Penicillium nucicola]